ncbi:N(6)-adenine-specific methyltransferase METTL4 isoform X3 [Panulirus ornatus]|uniref:N(6)-adenine-specific methyltransferase METTL4 isoform X3 n=1 Tax=Panulirus ornatus TaxID=150431 RepID=UPI003A86202B
MKLHLNSLLRMSVVYATQKSAILDHESWLMELTKKYKINNHEGEPTEHKRKNFQDLFDLRTPFLMDSQAEKIAKQLEESPALVMEPKRKKRKKDHMPQRKEKEIELTHIREMFTVLRQTPDFKLNYQFLPNIDDFRRNNSHIRNLRKRFMEVTSSILPQLDEYHKGDEFGTKMINDNKYLVPPDVHYVCDDVNNILLHTLGFKFDVIVMDPPWQNKYVRRRTHAHGRHHGYGMMSVKDILQLPVGNLLEDGALLVVWCTNSISQIQEFLEGLNVWDVKLVATWFWLKVTKAGEPVTPLEGITHGKQPYERVFLAKKCSQGVVSQSIPDSLVFCSVPSGIHSHKPPLYELLKKYVGPHPQCLELFARSLTPGWMCYGMEVLRLQHSFLFEDSCQDE